MLAILHHLSDDDKPAAIMDTLRAAMPAGSYLAISSFRAPGPEFPELRARTLESERLMVGQLGSGRWREHAEILAWFGDWELVEPGLVAAVDWRPLFPGHPGARDPGFQTFAGGLARKACHEH
jgi:hypothetical protein